ncbi:MULTISPECIES: XTP/dITP diphosphatase [Bacillus]|uniref:XTP/dITP diphosphatase n=1 Tax=Bacillus TaxID=1386 RepID=UPI000379B41A|nr:MULTISPECIES: XTP/dITP diphosphatase [Bacillus]AIK39964.1 non-canonical purine NTP pyrophosphatase, RdgB/HAM1 family [Bacillus pseudomycoides]AJI18851.1 non-canonical purine NTP pyrophosphatase, RdgB/HAM1 family [Bacillus pseudomycoides]MCX2826812.1 XTP/dITP diphosphatase [Bacillus sp. DHT2]MDR4917911.1 XTP/dITP diphosphatase [Bacillus pseudomycoides]MED4652458.1 XTP/dITP diphosphatase [Bacillus pseudomycoides]
MKHVVVATKNMGKVREFAELFERFDLEVKSLHDFPNIEEVEETGETFEENALLKADSLCKQLNSIVIADDSGLIVDTLNGNPGVRSARYAGEQKDDQANIDKVLTGLDGVSMEKRTARFYCALAVAFPEENKESVIVNGTCEGKILEQRRGENGFGYDPIFYVEEYKRAMAELTSDEKNEISHRGRALRKLEEKISAWFLEEE